MKKIKIANVNLTAKEVKDGLFFSIDLNAKNVNLALKLGANKLIPEIQKELDTKLGKDMFFYKGGTAIEDGITFRLKQKQSLLDKL
jgi:hypothetical protein